jgi:hypothetical protein
MVPLFALLAAFFAWATPARASAIYTVVPQQVTPQAIAPTLPNSFASLDFWSRADTGVVLSGSSVAALTDLSGSGNTLKQSSAGAQPTLSATSGPAGTPCVTFAAASSQFMQSANFGLAQPFYVWAVMKWTVSTQNQYALDGLVTNNEAAFYTSSTGVVISAGTTLAATIGTTSFDGYGLLYSGNSSTIAINNSVVAGPAAAGSAVPGGITIGCPAAQTGGFFSNIQVAEIAVFAGSPSAAELASLSTYRMGRYGF